MNYKEYQAMRQTKTSDTPTKYDAENRPKVHFANEFLSSDGSVAVVRFPYHSMDDVVYTPTHNITDWPGARYGKRVACVEQGGCPVCAEGIKVDIRVFVKFLTYTVDNGAVVLNNTIWDRPSAFADIDMKNLFDEYGDISKLLFKIKRSGTGTSTRYNIQPIINAAVYPSEVYVANFSELEQIDPVYILTKSPAQYYAIKHPNEAPVANAAVPTTSTQVVSETESFVATVPTVTISAAPATVTYTTAMPSDDPSVTSAPAFKTPTAYVYAAAPEQSAVPNPATPDATRRTVKYKF